MGTEGDNTRRCNCHRVSVAILNNGPEAYKITDATHKAKHTKAQGYLQLRNICCEGGEEEDSDTSVTRQIRHR